MQRTLAVLLQIAHAESGAPLAESAPVALGALASEICALYEPAAREKGFALTLQRRRRERERQSAAADAAARRICSRMG